MLLAGLPVVIVMIVVGIQGCVELIEVLVGDACLLACHLDGFVGQTDSTVDIMPWPLEDC